MRIMNLAEFLEQPKGTIFQKFERYVGDDLCLFDGRCGESDFFFSTLCGTQVEFNTMDQHTNLLDKACADDVPIDLDNCQRDGCFEPDNRFS